MGETKMSLKSVTLLFPGQGSQYVGMGKALEGHSSYEFLEKANKALEFPISKIMLNGPEEELKLTENTQPAILTHSIALFDKLLEILLSNNIKIDRVLGHSVGEYAALVACKTLSFEDAVKAVRLRGQFMQAAVPAGKGKMYAVMRVPQDLIVKACEEVSTDEKKVMPANFNEPNQIVISGEAETADKAVKWLEENFEGRMRAMELKVSAPFHSSLMEPAANELEKAFSQFEFKGNFYPYIANVDAIEYSTETSPEVIKKNLVNQVAGSVLWTQSIQSLPDDTVCIEVGPGKVLAGLIKKINPEIKVISLDKEGAFDEVKELIL